MFVLNSYIIHPFIHIAMIRAPRLTWRLGGGQGRQRAVGQRGEHGLAHVQRLGLEDGAHTDVQLVALVGAVVPQHAQELHQMHGRGQVHLGGRVRAGRVIKNEHGRCTVERPQP